VYSEAKFPWWAIFLVIAPVIVTPVIIRSASKLTAAPARIAKPGKGEPDVRHDKENEVRNYEALITLITCSCVWLGLIWAFVSMSKYSVEASDLGIRFGFRGILGKKFIRQDIISVRITECKMREFGGLGIRYGFKTKRWGYICNFGDGVHIEATQGAKTKKYAFSCQDAQACINAMNLSPRQMEVAEEES